MNVEQVLVLNGGSTISLRTLQASTLKIRGCTGGLGPSECCIIMLDVSHKLQNRSNEFLKSEYVLCPL